MYDNHRIIHKYFVFLHQIINVTMPKVSVIMPVYNVAPYLDAAFKSLLQQTLTDFEVIVVNDGSTDGSQKVIDHYAKRNRRIRSIYQSNQGQSVARNKALELAMGEYIYMMDSDDTISPDLLQSCYDYAELTKADFVFFDGDQLYEEGAKRVAWNYKRTHLCEEHKAYDGHQLLKMMLDKGKHSCVVWLLFIRKSFLDTTQLTFYPGIIHEDELFTTVLTLSSKNIYCLQQSLVQHRVRSHSTMGKHYSKRNVDCYLTVIDELNRYEQSDIVRQFSRYTLSKVFYTAHQIPFMDKFSVFLHAIWSGALKYIGWKSCLVFWLK